MRKRRHLLMIFITILVLSFASALSAQEQRQIDGNVISFGWEREPAYTLIFNSLEFTVADANGEPVAGLEGDLQLTAYFGDDASKTLEIHTVDDQPGTYAADIIPTRSGDYRFELSGMVNGVSIDETFDSANGDLSAVRSQGDILFPSVDDAVAALQAQVDDLGNQVQGLLGGN